MTLNEAKQKIEKIIQDDYKAPELKIELVNEILGEIFKIKTWNDYYYIYRDSLGRLNEATNPKFITEHTSCRAIPKHLGRNHLEKLLSGVIV